MYRPVTASRVARFSVAAKLCRSRGTTTEGAIAQCAGLVLGEEERDPQIRACGPNRQAI
jgi:hypothetical protein